MASPLKAVGNFLFGSPQQSQPMMLPPPQTPAAPPIQSPQGSPNQYKPQKQTSFLSAAAASAPTSGQTGGKSLLGQ